MRLKRHAVCGRTDEIAPIKPTIPLSGHLRLESQEEATATMTAALESFTLDDYVSLFIYDGPTSPEIYASELVSLAR